MGSPPSRGGVEPESPSACFVPVRQSCPHTTPTAPDGKRLQTELNQKKALRKPPI